MPIRAYLRHYLIPRLAGMGLDDDQIDRVAKDVGSRLTSIVCRWGDRRFRDTVLLLGEEEATFWKPDDVSLATRCLVVVGVRNSLLEDLSSTTEAARQLGLKGAVLLDEEMPRLTREAIRYFDGVDLKSVAEKIAPPPPCEDIFGDLAEKYPVTWRALAVLSLLDDGDCSFAPVSAEPPPLPIGRPAELALGSREGPRVLSGMAEQIEPELQRMLRLVRTGLYPGIFSDSFKMITRNPQKLFAVMEFVLAGERAVVTHNYYIRNGYVARRTPLVRPSHNVKDLRMKFHDLTGLLPGHAEAIGRFAPARL